MLKSTKPVNHQETASAAYIVEAAASLIGTTVDEINSHGRFPKQCLARHIAAYLMRERLGFSYPQIAKRLHHRHVATLYGCQKIARMVQEDPATAVLVERVWNVAVAATNKEAAWYKTLKMVESVVDEIDASDGELSVEFAANKGDN